MEQEYKRAGIEPPLEDLLNDRIAHLIMRRDGITLADVWRLVETVRARMVAVAQHGAEPQAPSTVEPGPDCTPGAYAGSSAG